WLAQPLPVAAAEDASVIELPVTGGQDLHFFKIIYASSAVPGTIWTRLEAPAPVLPVQVRAFRRTWCLPPGQAPLHDHVLDQQQFGAVAMPASAEFVAASSEL